jgi:hypothetical protein
MAMAVCSKLLKITVGLLEAVANVFSESPHGYCLKHLEENIHKAFKNADICSLL